MARFSKLSSKARKLLPGKSKEHASTHNKQTCSSDSEEASETDSLDPGSILDKHAAFNPGKLFDKEPVPVTAESIADKTGKAIRKAIKVASHPTESVQHKLAKTFALQDAPYRSRKADGTLLDAHNALSEAQESPSGGSEAELELERLQSEVDELEESRESHKAAWITRRFVQRAGVVRTKPYSLPDSRDPCYWTFDDTGLKETFSWHLYLAHRMRYAHQDYNTQYFSDINESGFDRDILRLHLERLIVASGPWQAWLLRLRKLTRWKEPSESAKWFAICIFIWICNRVFSSMLLWVIYITIRRRLNRSSREALRESHRRAQDETAEAFRFSEFTSRHGEGKWIEPLIDKCGPALQMQVADIADQLEVFKNFYDWTDSSKTLATLSLIAALMLYGNITGTDYVLRGGTLLAIGYFFLGRPVASLYPKYRHMVNPWKWIFWDVPTNAEWSFQFLRRQAEAVNSEIASKSMKDYAGLELRSFACSRHGQPGHFAVGVDYVCFKGTLTHESDWRRSLLDLERLSKIDRGAAISVAKLRNPQALQIVFDGGMKEVLEGMKQRDEVFNLIIGFSGFMWKQLPSLPDDFIESNDEHFQEVGFAHIETFYDACD